MDVVKLRTLAQKLEQYQGTCDYWEEIQQDSCVGSMLGLDALVSWNSRRTLPTTDAEYAEMSVQINTVLKPIMEYMWDLDLNAYLFPKLGEFSTTDSDPTEFDFEEDAALLDEVYAAFKSTTTTTIDVEVMAKLNEFLRELAAYPSMRQVKDDAEKAANFYTIADLQYRAQNTTLISDIDTLVNTSGGTGKPLTDEWYPVKELGALMLCKDLVVRKHWGKWIPQIVELFRDVGDVSYYLDYEITPQRKRDIDSFLLSLSVLMVNQVPSPVSMTNISEYELGKNTLALKDVAHYTASLINKFLDEGGAATQGELVNKIKDNLAAHSLAQLSSISKLLNLDVYDERATIGNFVHNGSYVNLEEIENFWSYVDTNSGNVE